ncbi:response regulator [Eubacterium sp. 1001713B170207_170306_E7]|uniref:response regulator transcription factor n=1 Tax=Eubacterium sp. 1001713B170207_170306_E7 TaxID=2787097 RepID=UPI001897CC0B|nr:response regulator [Eubacterium sp. 1001713B170207_170306_E7]
MYKLFIVEDEHLEIEAIELILSQYGKNITVIGKASSGRVALEEIRRLDPDIVLLDINIPEINGIDVLRAIKKEDQEKKVILITAFNEFDFAHQAIKARVDDFLLKPIRPQQLMESINMVISTLKANAKNKFDEKMSEVIFAVVQKKYSDARNVLTEYLDLLYDHYGYDLMSIQNEIQHFMEELNIVSMDTCGYDIKSPLRMKNNQQFVTSYKNRYDLKVEIMKVIDKIFDHLMDNKENRKNNIEDILNYIDRNCHKDISLDQVGEYANMSSYYLSKIFKKETGVNFVTYLTERKIEIAKDMLLNTDVPIINIALDLSYHEPNYFSKVFKKSTGMTPTEYRRLRKGDNGEGKEEEKEIS